ncbi:unnamed protein product [Schistosoma turkestanicum]|nr:unnamed protein product [Schistosoma turkestanicum]
MRTCEVYRPFPSESEDNIDRKVNNFPVTKSSVLHVVISESELTELPLPTCVCELCGIKVKTKANLRAHQIKTHKIMKDAKDVAFFSKQRYDVSYIYHCPVATCKHNINLGGGFSTHWRLKQHYQHVHMQKSYQCSNCKHFFPTPSYHAYHQKLCGATHSCSVCFKSYSSKKHLLQHYRRSGHCRNLTPNSTPEVENNPSKPPTRHTSISSSDVTCDPITFNGSRNPVILPLLIVPIPVPNVNGMNVENLNTSVVGCLNMNLIRTSALSALRTLSTQISPNPNVQVNLSESVINSSDTLVVLKPNLENLCSTDSVPESNLSLEASTQTEQSYTPITVSQPCSNTLQTHELVSVNTCTDEDDISSFIGGLFCNAEVEANFSQSSTVDDNYDIKEEKMLSGGKLITLDSLNKHHSCSSVKSAENSIQVNEYTSLTGCLNSGVDQEIQAMLLPLRENAAMQTDVVEKLNAEVATHYPHVDRSTYFTPSRMLETPPPPMLQSTVSLGTHLSTACQTLHRFLDEAKVSDGQPPLIETLNMDTTSDTGTQGCANVPNYPGYDSPSSTDPVLQCLPSSTSIDSSVQTNTVPTSCDNSQYCNLNTVETTTHDWSASVDFTHNETQTIDEDIELWLNSVETQTNIALFDPSFFSDICVGVDNNFFQS